MLKPGGELAVTTPAHGRRTGLSKLFLRGFERCVRPAVAARALLLARLARRAARRDGLRGALGQAGEGHAAGARDPLTRVSARPSQRVSDRVHERLRADILAGAARARTRPCPPSARWPRSSGCNRHAVREALKRLQQAGLVQISQGGATRVLDWRDGGGLEVLLDLVGGPGAAAPPPSWRAPCSRCARASASTPRGAAPSARRAARAAADRRGSPTATAPRRSAATPAKLDDAYAALWAAIVGGSGNIAYRLAFNSLLERARGPHGDGRGRPRPATPTRSAALGEGRRRRRRERGRARRPGPCSKRTQRPGWRLPTASLDATADRCAQLVGPVR